jgi:predicted adenine nucleotide alpha hydrolase (AANH) superfamily ATPase
LAFFYNPNIHPVQEFYARLEAVAKYNAEENIKSILDETYGLTDFVRKAVYRENDRCGICYAERIEKAAHIAKKGKFDFFTTTLLYSKQQNHEEIISYCEAASKKYSVKFHYEDYRDGWKEGIEESKKREMYRQQYCGCIYSEEDRYLKQMSKKYNELKSELGL